MPKGIYKREKPAWNKGLKSWVNTGSFKSRGKHPNWNGGVSKTTKGYIIIKKSDHPFANKKGYVYQHRLIMEKRIGRYLHTFEVVHHINHIKTDNRIKNLELMEKKRHDKIEAKRRWAEKQ